jgi:hypothetical protein
VRRKSRWENRRPEEIDLLLRQHPLLWQVRDQNIEITTNEGGKKQRQCCTGADAKAHSKGSELTTSIPVLGQCPQGARNKDMACPMGHSWDRLAHRLPLAVGGRVVKNER